MAGFVEFGGKTIVVFGASGGIGRQTCAKLDSLGARVILVGRQDDELQITAKGCKNNNIKIYPYDITKIDGLDELIGRIIEENGKLSGLVFSIGINEDIPIRNLSYSKMLRTFEVNYFSFVECVKQVSKRGRYMDGFRIVGVSSVSSTFGERAHCAYAGSKAAMDASVRVMAKELADKGIAINTVAPGMTKTKMTDRFIQDNGQDSDAYIRTMKRQYLGMAEPEDIANAICFLLSKEARMITGVMLPVDGGFSTAC